MMERVRVNEGWIQRHTPDGRYYVCKWKTMGGIEVTERVKVKEGWIQRHTPAPGWLCCLVAGSSPLLLPPSMLLVRLNNQRQSEQTIYKTAIYSEAGL